ncbi:plectrovirus-related protein [Spiroplasma citri]|nr:plectrovirus-related protein [Spiroplasma citri]
MIIEFNLLVIFIGANAPEFLYVISFVLFIVLFFGMFFKLIQKCGVFKNAKWLN